MHGHHWYLQKLSCPIAYSNPLTNLVMQLSTPRSLLKPKPTFAFLVLSSLNTLCIQEGENQDLDRERSFAPFTIARHPHFAKKKRWRLICHCFSKRFVPPSNFSRFAGLCDRKATLWVLKCSAGTEEARNTPDSDWCCFVECITSQIQSLFSPLPSFHMVLH